MNIHAKLHPLLHRTKKLLVRSISVGSYLIIYPYANRVDPDQAALTRAAWSWSALFAKVLKGVYMNIHEIIVSITFGIVHCTYQGVTGWIFQI